MDSSDKIKALKPAPKPRTHRRYIDEKLNDLESSCYSSLNRLIGWIVSNASVLCAEAPNRLQQLITDLLIKDLIGQHSSLRQLKWLETNISYPRTDATVPKHALVMVYNDVGHISEHGQLCCVAEILFNDLQSDYIFFPLSRARQMPHSVYKKGIILNLLPFSDRSGTNFVTYTSHWEMLIKNFKESLSNSIYPILFDSSYYGTDPLQLLYYLPRNQNLFT